MVWEGGAAEISDFITYEIYTPTNKVVIDLYALYPVHGWRRKDKKLLPIKSGSDTTAAFYKMEGAKVVKVKLGHGKGEKEYEFYKVTAIS